MLTKNFISHNCFSEKELTEITLTPTASTQAEASNIIISENILFLLPLILSLVYGSFLFGIVKLRDFVNQRFSEAYHPCRNCRFFAEERELDCALHPATALTKQAIDCCDYCPN